MRAKTVAFLFPLFLTFLTGCFETRQLPAVVPPDGSTTMEIIGEMGGTLALDDLLVTVPAGAVAAGTEITVTVEAAPTTGAFTAFSPIITFEPEGLVLDAPIEIRIPFRGDGRLASVFTQGRRTDGMPGAYVPRTTEISGDVAIAQMDYLASTFVGTACEGDDCSCEPNGQLDLLVVMDNSNSMAEEQALIRAQLPVLFEALATGDLNGDGTQDVAAFDSIRVGIVTSDMGVGAVTAVPTCMSPDGFGDGGILRSDSPSVGPPECMASYPSAIAEYSAGAPSSLAPFVEQVGCVGARGVNGCGFEQQLEASLVALSPNMATAYTSAEWSAPMYADGRVGQGDMANGGFLRDDSILAILWVTDEEDCSTTNSQIFNPANPDFAGVDLNLRCFTFPGEQHPVQRFVDGLVGLRHRPEDIVVAAITGTPTTFVATPGAIDYDALLADPAMEETVDPVMMNRLQASCVSTNGMAFPPRRIVSALQGIDEAGGRVALQSICDPTFDQLTTDFATQLGERASGGC